jgi:NADH:ubiquinone oxidoreductase subunit F (NADH-binding)
MGKKSRPNYLTGNFAVLLFSVYGFVFYEFVTEYSCQKCEIVRRVVENLFNQLSDLKNKERHKDKRQKIK